MSGPVDAGADTVSLKVRAGHPDFLDLPWSRTIREWDTQRFVDLPKGLSRHEVRYLSYDEGLYVVKELPTAAARQDYEVLRALETKAVYTAVPVGIVEGRHPDPGAEQSAALITRYVDLSFSYMELLQGAGFGTHRDQMLDAFAGLLVELHLAGCFWGDCSLANVLYRYDAEAIDAIMIDAETARLHEGLSRGQREEDLEIMMINVAGGMADIAVAHGRDLDEADFSLGEDIAHRYRALWGELTDHIVISPDERYKITEKLTRLNDLGFTVDEMDLLPTGGGGVLSMRVKVGGRNYHASRLRALTGVDALERQARQILSDLHYHQAKEGVQTSAGKEVSAVRWRVNIFEPLLERLRGEPDLDDTIQAYCDLLHHRYLKSMEMGSDIGTQAAVESWLAAGKPGYL